MLRLQPSQVKLKTLKKGSTVIGGTVLGRVGKLKSGPGSKLAPHLNFSIRPAGRGAPRIDPKPILDGWKLLEATAIYRAAGRNPFVDQSAANAGQVLLMSKEALAARVLADQDVDIYAVRPRRHPHRPDRPPRARDARVPVGLRPAARRSPRSSAATAS